ncbi:MAG: hypothetical protein WC121_14125 [Candidatus Kapaibacterium sp.]
MKFIILIVTIFILFFLEIECVGIYKSIFPSLYEGQLIDYLDQTKKIDNFNLLDTLEVSLDKVLSTRKYKVKEDYIELGYVLFNKEVNKANIFYYELDDNIGPNSFDYIHIIAAFFNGDAWVFETNNTPTLGLDRKEFNHGKPFTFKGIKEFNKNEILKSRYICSLLKGINFDYVDNAYYIKNLVDN